MRKIYISLPITGYDLKERKATAERLKAELVATYHDAEVITPFDVCNEPDLPYGEYLGRDITALLTCQAIYMCDGWLGSKGCQLEYKAAQLYELEILT